MARHEDIVNTFWDDVDHLSDDAVLLYLWSWTNQKCGMAGIYKIARRKIAEGRLDGDRLDAALAELEEDGKLRYVDGVLWNCARVKRLSMISENIGKSIARDLGEIEDSHPLAEEFVVRYGNHPKLEPHLTLARPSAEGQEIGSTPTKRRPSTDPHPRVPGQGQGIGQGSGQGEFNDWLEHYVSTTGYTAVRGSKPAREAFAARRREGLSLDDLKLATVGCHSDAYNREHHHDVPETILRASKVTRYIKLASSPAATGDDPVLAELAATHRQQQAEEAAA